MDQEPQGQNANAAETGLAGDQEPETTGTLFILLVFLMALAGLWVLMYFTLLGR